MEIRAEYKKIINKLLEIKENELQDKNKQLLDEVIHSINTLSLNTLKTEFEISDNVKHFTNITKNMIETYIAKNHDYGNSFDQSVDEFGIVAAVVRIGDKMNRIKSLIKKEAKVSNESIKDTLLDMANYAILTLMWLDNKDGK